MYYRSVYLIYILHIEYTVRLELLIRHAGYENKFVDSGSAFKFHEAIRNQRASAEVHFLLGNQLVHNTGFLLRSVSKVHVASGYACGLVQRPTLHPFPANNAFHKPPKTTMATNVGMPKETLLLSADRNSLAARAPHGGGSAQIVHDQRPTPARIPPPRHTGGKLC